MKKNKLKGFTVIELLVVIGIISILVGFGLPSYFYMKKNISFYSSVESILNTLRLAQNRAISSQDGTIHGVYFETDQCVLYGEDWSSPTYTRAFPLESGKILGASTNVEFERLTGEASSQMSIVVEYSGRQKIINVEETGKISIQ